MRAGEDVLFSVNGKAVTTDEFSRYCFSVTQNKTDLQESRLDEYITFRLKVEDATAIGLDTLTEFRQQLEVLRSEVIRSYMNQDGEKGNEPQIVLTIASIRLPQNASYEAEWEALSRMRSFWDIIVANGGRMDNHGAEIEVETNVVIPEAGLLKEFSAQLATMSAGQISRPFVSPMGVHIVKLVGYVAANKRNGGEAHAWSLSERLQTIRDGMLAAFWEEYLFGKGPGPGCGRDKALSSFYEQHQEEYLWDLPHYKGAVVRCADKKCASKIKKALKKLPVEQWNKRLNELRRRNPEWKATIESGLFCIGESPYVDNLVFKCGKLPRQTDGLYVFVIGKKLIKGPESYRDVLAQVSKDYFNWQKKEYLKQLRARYKVEINQDVLKTVNSYASK